MSPSPTSLRATRHVARPHFLLVTILLLALLPPACKKSQPKRAPISPLPTDATLPIETIRGPSETSLPLRLRQQGLALIAAGDFKTGVRVLRKAEQFLDEDPETLEGIITALLQLHPASLAHVKGGADVPEALVYLHRLCLLNRVRCTRLRRSETIEPLLATHSQHLSWIDTTIAVTAKAREHLSRVIRLKRGLRDWFKRRLNFSVSEAILGNFDGDAGLEIAFRPQQWPAVVYVLDRVGRDYQLRYVTHSAAPGEFVLGLSAVQRSATGDEHWLRVRWRGFVSEYDGADLQAYFYGFGGTGIQGCFFLTQYLEDPSGGIRRGGAKPLSPGLPGCRGRGLVPLPAGSTIGEVGSTTLKGKQRSLVVNLFPGGRFNDATALPVRWSQPKRFLIETDRPRWRAIPLSATLAKRLAQQASELLRAATSQRGQQWLHTLRQARTLLPTDPAIQLALLTGSHSARSPTRCNDLKRLLQVAGKRALPVLRKDASLAKQCPEELQ